MPVIFSLSLKFFAITFLLKISKSLVSIAFAVGERGVLGNIFSSTSKVPDAPINVSGEKASSLLNNGSRVVSK